MTTLTRERYWQSLHRPDGSAYIAVPGPADALTDDHFGVIQFGDAVIGLNGEATAFTNPVLSAVTLACGGLSYQEIATVTQQKWGAAKRLVAPRAKEQEPTFRTRQMAKWMLDNGVFEVVHSPNTFMVPNTDVQAMCEAFTRGASYEQLAIRFAPVFNTTPTKARSQVQQTLNECAAINGLDGRDELVLGYLLRTSGEALRRRTADDS